MPRKPMRARRVMLVLTLGMLAVVVAAWGMSYFRQACLVKSEYSVSEKALVPPREERFYFRRKSWLACNDVGSVSLSRWEDGNGPYELERMEKMLVGQGWRYWFQRVDTSVTSSMPTMYWHSSSHWRLFGLGWDNNGSGTGNLYTVQVSHWVPALVLGLVAFWLWYPQRRSVRRRANNQCVKCGYDRRGLTSTAACPECGHVVESQSLSSCGVDRQT